MHGTSIGGWAAAAAICQQTASQLRGEAASLASVGHTGDGVAWPEDAIAEAIEWRLEAAVRWDGHAAASAALHDLGAT